MWNDFHSIFIIERIDEYMPQSHTSSFTIFKSLNNTKQSSNESVMCSRKDKSAFTWLSLKRLLAFKCDEK